MLRILCTSILAALTLSWAPPQYAAALRRWGGDSLRAERVADAVVRWSDVRQLDPAVVLGIIRVENPTLTPRAVARDGSVGIMQVQPGWKHAFGKQCGVDLFDIDTNICYGTAVLALNMAQTTTLEQALIRYNGCAHASCRRYARWVVKFADQARDTTNDL